MSQALVLFERATVAAEKLANEVSRLRVDVVRLHARLDPFAGEPERPYPEDAARPKTLDELLQSIDDARRYIFAIERDVSRIRGVVDAIDADAIAREEMKPFLRR